MVHITLDGYTGAAERRPRRDARPLHTGTTLFRSSLLLYSLSLSSPLLSPPPTSHRLPPSISFSHRVPSIGLLCSSPLYFSFALSIAFHSPSCSPPTPLSTLFTDSGVTLSFSLLSRSVSLPYSSSRVCPRRVSDHPRFPVLFLHRLSQAVLSSIAGYLVSREQSRTRQSALRYLLPFSSAVRRSLALLALRFLLLFARFVPDIVCLSSRER